MSIRFAPSPTGDLHVGNLRTAWISWRLSQLYSMPWHLRFEDIDGPRVVPGSLERQLSDLAALGMKPTRMTIQSANRIRHRMLFEKARQEGLAYPCTCSRREIGEALEHSASAPHSAHPALYTGNCRNLTSQPGDRARSDLPGLAWRFRMPVDTTGASDFILGRTSLDGDSWRTFSPAYHWACAIDDIDGKHEILVRSIDLTTALPLQRAIWHWLGASPGPAVFHTALVVQEIPGDSQQHGRRLEKRTRGVTWFELKAQGFTPEKLLRAFEHSFRPPLRIPGPGTETAETIGQIAVTRL
ncbi:MAG: glutamate--tRNA ligase family protein, partial [Bdellovibrionota bacterium]